MTDSSDDHWSQELNRNQWNVKNVDRFARKPFTTIGWHSMAFDGIQWQMSADFNRLQSVR